MDDDLTKKSATELAALMRARRVSPVEVLEAHLRRIELLNPRLNAIVTLAPDAMERAREAERALMGGARVGALCGVPVTIKDTIATKDLRTTSGSTLRAMYVPERDASAVARLKAAGAIVLGKTNVSEMAMAYDADNPVFGRTNNPHDLTLTPGGSSGGCAAAVSARLVPASLGSDLAGSIRVPAHFCGVSGLKPTAAGDVPTDGHFPQVTEAFALGASFGPIARSVEDLTLLYRVLAGKSARDETAESKRKVNLRGRCAAWYVDDLVSPVTEETKDAVKRAAAALSKAGLITFEALPPNVEHAQALWLELFQRTTFENLQKLYAGRVECAGEYVRAVLAFGSKTASTAREDVSAAHRKRETLLGELLDWMKTAPLIIAPVGAVAAFPHETRRVTVNDTSHSVFRAFSYAQAYNVFGLPAVTIPAGRTRANLPVGVQIVGRPFAEDEVLAAAAIVEQALGGWMPPPLVNL